VTIVAVFVLISIVAHGNIRKSSVQVLYVELEDNQRRNDAMRLGE